MRLSTAYIFVLLLAALNTHAQGLTARFPLDADAVVVTLSASGLSVNAGDITLPADLTAAVTHPVLRITHAEAVQGERVRLRLVCENGGDCLPFFAVLQRHGPGKASATASQLGLESPRTPSTTYAKSAVLRAGTRAVFLLQTEHMRITIPVVSIDSGAPGAEVRVASLDHKQLYHGVVSDSTTVRGTLP